MAGKKFTRNEFIKAGEMRKDGATWEKIARFMGRNSASGIASAYTKFGGNYDAYLDSFGMGGAPNRKTEQLKMVPPKMTPAPKKIQVRSISEDELTAYKLRLARKQAIAINNFIKELKDAGLR